MAGVRALDCGAIFTAPLVFNPFFASFYPGSYAKSGPLRWLPVELTLVYDWPTNTERARTVAWFGDHPGGNDIGFQLYFFDDNRYLPEVDKSFWVKGESRAEFVIKTDKPISRAVLTLTAGPVPTDVVVTSAAAVRRSPQSGRSSSACSSASSRVSLSGHVAVWTASVSSSRGFVPIFYDPSSTDTRYLGVRVEADAERRNEPHRRRHLEPADGRGRPHGDRAFARAGARERPGTTRKSSSHRRTASAARRRPIWRPG